MDIKRRISRVICYLIVLSGVISCTSFRKQLHSKGDSDIAIKNAIIDFSKTSKLYKQDRIFSVRSYTNLEEAIEIPGLLEEGKEAYYQQVMAVSIMGTNQKFIRPDRDTKHVTTPNKHVEKENKLFYWWDENAEPINDETIATLERYNLLLENNIEGQLEFYELELDDTKKGVNYYICKDDLTNYKKIITSKAIGYYSIPEIDCEDW